jgi:3-oxoacyl-[acyl-carrier protein] reductase
MDLGLTGKVALVSGGSSGMGLAAAAELASEGAKVVIVARNRERLATAAKGLQAGGAEIGHFSADMADEAGVAAAVEYTTSLFGAPDIVVANVLPPHRIGFDNCTTEDFLKSYEYLTMSIVYLARAVIGPMKERRWGRIINIGSHSVKEPHLVPSVPLANMGRVSAVALLKTLATELGPYSITANTIAVGTIKTPRSDWFLKEVGATEEWWATEKREIPAGRFGRPEEIAAVIAFLASTRASFVSGETIRVDAGAGRALF